MHTFYQVVGKIGGETEVLYGSFVKQDCRYELECDGEQWKDEGYTNLKIQAIATDSTPDPEVYTAEELEGAHE